MKKSKYLLLIISICTLCLILAGCAVSAKYTSMASKDIGVGSFAFDAGLTHTDENADSICDYCGKVLCDHTSRTYHAAVPHTCTVNGVKEYWSCNGCDLLFDAASGGNTVTETELVDPASHSFENAVCTVCGQKLLYGGYINWVNNNEFSSETDAKVTEESQPVHDILPGKILPTDRALNLRGWLIMEGGVTGYGYSVNGGEWIDATAAGSYTGGISDYTNAFQNITNPGDMTLAGFPEADGGINLDLSAYVGQCVTVVFGAKGNLTGTQYVPVVTINNVHVKTGFAADVATIDGVEYGGIGTHLSGGFLHQNVTAQDDALLDIGGWMMADGGQGDLKWSVDGDEYWFNPTSINYIDGGVGHTTAAGANAGQAPAGWELTNAAFEAKLDLTAYRGKTITVTLGRDATAIGERIKFGYIEVTVPGAASHECVGNNWTDNGDGTHTGYCTTCKANVTEACAAAAGVYEKNTTQHWQVCAKCGVEISGTRTDHGVPTQTLCTDDKTCPTCAYVITAASDNHSLNGQYVSDENYTTHTITCSVLGCGYTETENCVGPDDATCIKHASCDKCGGAYGTVNPNNHSSANVEYVDNNDDATHTVRYYCCKVDKEVIAHTTSLMTVSNGTYHVVECSYCKYQENVNCSGGSATCTEQAVCTGCNTAYGTVTVHDYTSTSSTAYKATDATCQAAATYYKTCTMCGGKGTETFSSGSTIGHDYTSTSSTAYKATDATCTEAATYYKTCTMCGGKGTETFSSGNALNHTGGTATCQTEATCSICGAKYGNKADHSYTNNKQVSAATCTTAEKRTWYCSTCGADGSDYDGQAALGHSYAVSGTQVKCSRCSDVLAKAFAKGENIAQYMTHTSGDITASTATGYTNFASSTKQGCFCINLGQSGSYAVVQYHLPTAASGSNPGASGNGIAIQGCVVAGAIPATYVGGGWFAETNSTYTSIVNFGQSCPEFVVAHQSYTIIQLRYVAICDTQAQANTLQSLISNGSI